MAAQFLENILDNVDAGIYATNPNGDVIYVNNRTVQMFGYNRQELLGFNTYQLAEQKIIDRHILAEVMRSKRPTSTCQVFRYKSENRKTPMMVTQTPILDSHGEVKYVVGIVRDIETLISAYAATKEVPHGKVDAAARPIPNHFIYRSTVMNDLVAAVDKVASSDATVLLLGESGTGKEVLAHYIHSTSPRSGKAMITINCAALPENLLEAELFGYKKGAFTGALADGKQGLIELSNESTLFLDEIDSMPLAVQGKLLRVLETHEIRRIGSVTSQKVEFRLIAATNADLAQKIKDKTFRMDLYYRLAVVPVTIPPLRQRREDIRPLCEAFLVRYEQKYGRTKEFLDSAYETLYQYDWPGNVRELKNFIERMVLMTDHSVEQIKTIPPELLGLGGGQYKKAAETLPRTQDVDNDTAFCAYQENKTLKAQVRDYERWLIKQALKHQGTYAKAAQALGIDKSTLIRKQK